MKLAVLGVTTVGAGQDFVQHALHCGYSVNLLTTALPNATPDHENLTVIQGSLDSKTDIMKALKGCHAVVGLPDSKYTFPVLRTIVDCMYESNIGRIIVATGVEQLQDMTNEISIAAVLGQSTLDWTIVQSALGNETLSPLGRDFAISVGDFTKFLVGQITDVRHLQSAVMVTS